MSSIDATLSERGQRYGEFRDHAEHSLAIKALLFTLMGEEKAKTLKADQVEALNMIAHKLARITNGDPHYDDSWRDVAGYAQLVANRLAKTPIAAPAAKPAKPEKEEPPSQASVRTIVVDIDVETIDEVPDELKNVLKRFITPE